MIMEIKLKTLTPIWTGGVETGKMDRLHETGIIGSLRWWYEAIVRGLGGDVCDPTSNISDNRCPQNETTYCSVCQLFGATGQQRQFRLTLGTGNKLFDKERVQIPSGRIHNSGKKPRLGGWFVMGQSVMGENIDFNIIPLTPSGKTNSLLVVCHLISIHAMIGAKVSNGYGVVSLTDKKTAQPIQGVLENFNDLISQSPPTRNNILPDIRDFFFAKFRFDAPNNKNWWQTIKGINYAWSKNVHGYTGYLPNVKAELSSMVEQGVIPIAPTIRNWLRYQWTHGLNQGQENYLFGTTNRICPICYSSNFKQDRYDNRKNYCSDCRSKFLKGTEIQSNASKINVSHAYHLEDKTWEFRLWGWLPSQQPSHLNLNRDRFLSDLQATLTDNGMWNDIFNPKNNISKPQFVNWYSLNGTNRDAVNYLRQLLTI